MAEALSCELPSVVPREVTVLRMPGKVSVLTAASSGKPNKIYAIDTGNCNAMSLGHNHDAGARLVNAVYNTLRSRGINPDYVVATQKTEVDFVYRDDHGWHFVQSCLSLSPPETAARELRSLNDIMELHKDVARLIVTLNDDFFKGAVRAIPLWY